MKNICQSYLLYNWALCTDVGSAISETMTLSSFLTDAAASELQVSSSRFQELETSYVTQKSEVIHLAYKNKLSAKLCWYFSILSQCFVCFKRKTFLRVQTNNYKMSHFKTLWMNAKICKLKIVFVCLFLCGLVWALAETQLWAGGEARGSRDSDQTAVIGKQNPPATKRGLGQN